MTVLRLPWAVCRMRARTHTTHTLSFSHPLLHTILCTQTFMPKPAKPKVFHFIFLLFTFITKQHTVLTVQYPNQAHVQAHTHARVHTRTHAHARTHTPNTHTHTPNTHTHTHARARARTHTHTRTHARTHTTN